MRLEVSPEDIHPIVESVVAEMLERFGNDGRLAYSETEGAAMLGVARHVLRDERLRGRIHAGKVGNKVRYSRRQLLAFIDGRGAAE